MKSSESQSENLNNNLVRNALIAFHEKVKHELEQSGQAFLTTLHDEQWCSPCEKGDANDGQEIAWEFYPLATCLDFTNVEQALGLSINANVKAFFGWFFSDNLAAKTADGGLELLQPWNQDDFKRLQENLIGHVLMKQKLKQPVTFFIAVTDEEDIIITVDNDSGEVWAEQVGCKPHKFLAASIAEFIDSLEPVIP